MSRSTYICKRTRVDDIFQTTFELPAKFKCGQAKPKFVFSAELKKCVSARERDRDDLLVVSGECANSAFNVETRQHVRACAHT